MSSGGSTTDVSLTGSEGKRAYSSRNKKRLKRMQQHYRGSTNTSHHEPYLKRARLFVGNIQPNITSRSDLVKLFSKYGDVLGVSVHSGFAFIQMDQERAANRAINYTDNSYFKGSRIGKSPSLAVAICLCVYTLVSLYHFVGRC